MIFAEKLNVNSKEWIKVHFKSNALLDSSMRRVKGAIFNPSSSLWAVPYESRSSFEAIMGDYLIIWKDSSDAGQGGISEDSIPSKPLIPGYGVDYNEVGEIVDSTGFKTSPWGEFQVKGFNLLVDRPYLILADEQGLGKTWQVATAMEARKKLGHVKRGVVLCKASLLYNWRDEIHMHTNEKAVVAAGTLKERVKIYNDCIYNDDWTFLIVSYETFRVDIAIMQTIDNMKGLDFCILDEAHKIKNSQNRIGTVIHYIPFKYKYVLTATPLPNSPLEAYNYLAWGGLTDQNWFAFRNTYAIMGGYNNKEIIGYKNIRRLQSLIQSNMLRRLKKDKLKELPEVVFKTISVPLTKNQAKLYNAVKKEIMQDLTDTTLQQIPNALSKLLRLQQITDSPALIGHPDEFSAKMEALDDLLEDFIEVSGNKVIVFSRFVEMILLLAEKYSKYNPAVIYGDVDASGMSRNSATRKLRNEIEDFDRLSPDKREKLIEYCMTSDRQKEVYKFQGDDTCKLFLGTSPACREGLTLTAATHVIFYDSEWSYAYNEQAYSRAHRIGQKNAVTVYYLVCENTVDEYVLEIVRNKEIMANVILSGGGAETNAPGARQFIAGMIGEKLAS